MVFDFSFILVAAAAAHAASSGALDNWLFCAAARAARAAVAEGAGGWSTTRARSSR